MLTDEYECIIKINIIKFLVFYRKYIKIYFWPIRLKTQNLFIFDIDFL